MCLVYKNKNPMLSSSSLISPPPRRGVPPWYFMFSICVPPSSWAQSAGPALLASCKYLLLLGWGFLNFVFFLFFRFVLRGFFSLFGLVFLGIFVSLFFFYAVQILYF